MTGFMIAMHVIICALLILIILVQSGRGAGLVESFSGVESMFGSKTNTFLTRATTILSTLFFITCIGLALLSARQSRSLMRGIDIKTEIPAPVAATSLKEEKSVSEPLTQPQNSQNQTQTSQTTANSSAVSNTAGNKQ